MLAALAILPFSFVGVLLIDRWTRWRGPVRAVVEFGLASTLTFVVVSVAVAAITGYPDGEAVDLRGFSILWLGSTALASLVGALRTPGRRRAIRARDASCLPANAVELGLSEWRGGLGVRPQRLRWLGRGRDLWCLPVGTLDPPLQLGDVAWRRTPHEEWITYTDAGWGTVPDAERRAALLAFEIEGTLADGQRASVAMSGMGRDRRLRTLAANLERLLGPPLPPPGA